MHTGLVGGKERKGGGGGGGAIYTSGDPMTGSEHGMCISQKKINK